MITPIYEISMQNKRIYSDEKRQTFNIGIQNQLPKSGERGQRVEVAHKTR